jgi:hypothetical protein
MTPWSHSALHQAVKRDSSMQIIELLVERGANPSLPNTHGAGPQRRLPPSPDAAPRSCCSSNEGRHRSLHQ